MLYVADWFHDKYDRYIDKTETYRWGQGCSVYRHRLSVFQIPVAPASTPAIPG